MRPLLIVSGQALARADGLNLVRRLRDESWVDEMAERLPRSQRFCLDALLREAAADAPLLGRFVAGIRRIAREERRMLSRKRQHLRLFAVLAKQANDRSVLHLTTNVDGLTTAVATAMHGVPWPGTGETLALADLENRISQKIKQNRGLIHIPLHGEAGLLLGDLPEAELRYQFLDQGFDSPLGHMTPTLFLGAAGGLESIESRLPTTALALRLALQMLRGAHPWDEGMDSPPGTSVAADFLLLGHGVGTRADPPSSPVRRLIQQTVALPPGNAGRRIAVLHVSSSQLARTWLREQGFEISLYAADLAVQAEEVLATLSLTKTQSIRSVLDPVEPVCF